MWLAETHYPVGDAFPAVIVPEVVLPLAVHPRDDLQIAFFSDSQQVFCILMAPLNLTYLLQYLAEQVTQPACNLHRLAPAVLALFPVCRVRLLHVKELCPGAVDSQSPAQLAHRRIALLNPFTQQLRVSRITHLALIARRIRVHRVQVLHVRSPLVGEYALELLHLQLPCKASTDAPLASNTTVVSQKTSNSTLATPELNLNSQRMALPVALLDTLSVHYPNAKILAKDEYDRYHIRVRDDMNARRRELSDFL